MRTKLISGLRPRLPARPEPRSGGRWGSRLPRPTRPQRRPHRVQEPGCADRVYLGPDGARPALSRAARGSRLRRRHPPAPPEVRPPSREKGARAGNGGRRAPESYEPAIGDMTPDEFGALLDARAGPADQSARHRRQDGRARRRAESIHERRRHERGRAGQRGGGAQNTGRAGPCDAPRVLAGVVTGQRRRSHRWCDGDARLKRPPRQRSDHGGVWRLF